MFLEILDEVGLRIKLALQLMGHVSSLVVGPGGVGVVLLLHAGACDYYFYCCVSYYLIITTDFHSLISL